ncbi:UpxY family transcription antiterminator [Fodinibius halophilus]|uniref:UpxY family transcription antiterminator n=1 Tax=Fodinibius halophilus TaxID=1736908 RepID=A0A6M1TBM8_9BACT|nr:UpxY family transcription antiterminator [Fodinibius halophilus]NGP88334.1 UpxY family transcription antiterminator [Fodinibius halophilus]
MTPSKGEKRWMAVYTAPRAEKKVCERLEEKDIEVYLPLQKEQRQWSDRKKIVETPIISSYVFVKCTEARRRKILQTYGVLNFVFYRGKPAVIRDEEMELMWKFLADYDYIDLEVKQLERGQKVTVESGPLKGKDGEVVYTKENRVCIQIESLGLQIRAEVEGVMLNEK